MSVNEYFMVVDTETGGLKKDQHALLEIAAVVYDYNGNCVDSFCEVIADPVLTGGESNKKLTLTALKINKIFSRMDKAKPASEVALSFSKWSIEVVTKYKPMLVGQNLQFDTGFIDDFMSSLGFEGWSELFHYHRMDTIPVALMLKRVGVIKCEKVSLESLVKEFGVELLEAHTALADSHATAKVYLAMLACLRDRLKCSL